MFDSFVFVNFALRCITPLKPDPDRTFTCILRFLIIITGKMTPPNPLLLQTLNLYHSKASHVLLYLALRIRHHLEKS